MCSLFFSYFSADPDFNETGQLGYPDNGRQIGKLFLFAIMF